MKIIPLEQGTQEWLSWRKTVITATDCPAILGSSPWSTPYKCWQRKLDLSEEQKTTEAMERGKRLEPEAREHFIRKYGINMAPAVVENEEFDFLGASLDGLSDCKKYILEIKCGGTNLHNMASQGIVPDYYLDQIQHQLFVTGAEKCFYYSYDGKDGICIEIFPDPNFEERFMPMARAFWKCVAFSEAPPLKDSDYKDMSHTSEWTIRASEYKKICEQMKNLEEEKEKCRKALLELGENQNCKGDGIKITKTFIRGRIVYEDIPEIKELNLDKYRKATTATWKIFIS